MPMMAISPAGPHRLIDYVAVCGLGTEKHCLDKSSRLHTLLPSGADQIGGSSHVASLLDRYPPQDHPACELPRMLPSVALPQGVRCYSRGENPDQAESMPREYTAILTDTQGAKIYVAVLFFRDAIDPFIARVHGVPHPSFADKCLCLVSRMPFLDDFSRILQQLHRLSFLPTGCPRPVWELAADLTSMLLPESGTTLLFTFQKQLYPFILPDSSRPRSYNVSFLPLVENLSVDAILALFTAALLEHKILLLSSNTALLTDSAEALAALLFPLKWTGVFVPVLPLDALECLDAPVPFIYGLSTENFELHIEELEGVLVVDMDSGCCPCPLSLCSVTWTSSEDHSITSPEVTNTTGRTSGEVPTRSSQVPQLPRRVALRLKKALAHLIKPHTATSPAVSHALSWEDQALRDLCLGLGGSRWSPKHDNVFHVIFIRAMTEMLRGYRPFLRDFQGAWDGGNLALHQSSFSDAFDTKGFLKYKEETMGLQTEPSAKAFMAALTATHAWMAFLAEESDPHEETGSDNKTFFQEALAAGSLDAILSLYHHPRDSSSSTFFTPLAAEDPVYHRPNTALPETSFGAQNSAGLECKERGQGSPQHVSSGTCCEGVRTPGAQPVKELVHAQFPESPASLVAAARAQAAAQKLHRQSAHAREELQAEEERVRLDMLARLYHHLTHLSADPPNGDAAEEVLKVLDLFDLRGVSTQYFVPCIEEWFRELSSFPRQGSSSFLHRASDSAQAPLSFRPGPTSFQGNEPLPHQRSVPTPPHQRSKAGSQPVALGNCVQLLAAALGLAHRQKDFVSAAALVDMASQVLVPAGPGHGGAKVLLVSQLRGLDIWHGVGLWAALLDMKCKKGGQDCTITSLDFDQIQGPHQKQQKISSQQQQEQQRHQPQVTLGKQKQAQGQQLLQQQQKQKQNPSTPKQPIVASKQVQEAKTHEKGKQTQEKGKQAQEKGAEKEKLAQGKQQQQAQERRAQKNQVQEQQAQEQQERQSQERQSQERLCLSPSLVQSLVQVMSQVGLEETEMSIILDTLAAGLPLKMQILLRDQFAQMQVLVRPAATHASTFLSFLRRPSVAEGASGRGGGKFGEGPDMYSDKLHSDKNVSEQHSAGAVSSSSLRWMQAVARVRSSVRQTH